jgi:hypothetical protein
VFVSETKSSGWLDSTPASYSECVELKQRQGHQLRVFVVFLSLSTQNSGIRPRPLLLTTYPTYVYYWQIFLPFETTLSELLAALLNKAKI